MRTKRFKHISSGASRGSLHGAASLKVEKADFGAFQKGSGEPQSWSKIAAPGAAPEALLWTFLDPCFPMVYQVGKFLTKVPGSVPSLEAPELLSPNRPKPPPNPQFFRKPGVAPKSPGIPTEFILKRHTKFHWGPLSFPKFLDFLRFRPNSAESQGRRGIHAISHHHLSEDAMGGWKKVGRGKPHDWHPSQKGLLDPPRTVRFPPPSGVVALFFLYKTPRLSRPEALLEGSRIFREGAFSGTFSSPHTFLGCTRRGSYSAKGRVSAF